MNDRRRSSPTWGRRMNCSAPLHLVLPPWIDRHPGRCAPGSSSRGRWGLCYICRVESTLTLIFLLLLSGCGGPSAGSREAPGEAAGSNVPLVAVRVDVSDPTTLPGKGTITIIGYPPSSMNGDWPTPGTRPSLVWTTGTRTFSWPMDLEVPLPAGLTFLLIVDVDGDGRPGPGDRMAAPIKEFQALVDGEVLGIVIDRAFDPDASHQEASGSPGEVAGTAALPTSAVVLDLTLDPSVTAPKEAAIFLLSFPRSTLVGGSPTPGAQPVAYWARPSSALRFPLAVDAHAPAGLDSLLLIDADGDGAPGPGDLLGGPAVLADPLPAGTHAPVRIDRRWNVGAPQLPGGSEPVAVRVVARSGPGLPRLASAPVFLVSYGDGGLSSGNPRPGSLPLRTWTREAGALAWPLTLEGLAVPGSSVLVLVDADGDGSPGPGDLLGGPILVPTTVQAGTRFDVEVDRVWNPGAQVGGDRGDVALRVLVRIGKGVTLPRNPTVFVASYPAAGLDQGAPRPGMTPMSMWSRPPGPLTWPLDLSARVVPGSAALVFVDEGDGFPGPGDHLSEPLIVPATVQASTILETTMVGRVFRPGGAEGGSLGGGGVAVQLVVRAGPSAKPPAQGALFLLGYPKGGLLDGGPPPGVVPAFFWSRPAGPLTWPMKVDGQAAAGLDLVLIVDTHGDRTPGPGDLLSLPVQSAADLNAGSTLNFSLEGRQFASPGAETTLSPDSAGMTPSGGGVSVHLTVRAGPGLKPPARAAIFLLGYPKGGIKDGSPAPGVAPAFFWSRPPESLRWPLDLDALAEGGLDFVLLLDADGDGKPGPGDMLTPPVATASALAAGTKLQFVLEGRLFSDKAPGNVANTAPGRAGIDAHLRVELAAGVTLPGSGALFVAGYDNSSLDQGRPRQGARPLFFWSRDAGPLKAPIECPGRVEPGLTHLLFVDTNGDGAEGPGDLLSAPVLVSPRPADPVRFTVVGRFDPKGGAADSGPLGGGAAQSGVGPPSQRGIERRIRVSVAQGLVTPPSGTVFVLGFPDSGMLNGSPRSGIRPLFGWQSPAIQLPGPVELAAQLPQDLLTVMVVLDSDGSGEPGPGDLMSAPLASFRAPAAGQAAVFVVDRGFSLPERDTQPKQGPTTNDEAKDRGDGSILPSWLRGGK